MPDVPFKHHILDFVWIFSTYLTLMVKFEWKYSHEIIKWYMPALADPKVHHKILKWSQITCLNFIVLTLCAWRSSFTKSNLENVTDVWAQTQMCGNTNFSHLLEKKKSKPENACMCIVALRIFHQWLWLLEETSSLSAPWRTCLLCHFLFHSTRNRENYLEMEQFPYLHFLNYLIVNHSVW